MMNGWIAACLVLLVPGSHGWWWNGGEGGGSTTTLAPVHPIQLAACPVKPCTVNQQKDIKCPHSGCSEISPEIPGDVGGIFLQGNHITSVPELNYDNLTQLDLSNNNISQLDDHAFFYLKKLEALYLSRNRIRAVKAGHFSSLIKLRYLYLDTNLLTIVPNEVFYPSLLSLQKLDLSGNLISHIEQDAFSDISSLMFLHLQNNNISSIKRQHWRNLPRLETILLSQNRISGFDEYTFGDLPQLRKLDLSYNEIWALGNNTFSLASSYETSQLEQLELSNNNIETIHGDVFTDLVNLQFLRLAYNKIQVVPPGALPGSLRNIYLHHMPSLVEVQAGAFSGLSALKHVQISHNRNLRTIAPGAFNTTFESLKLLDLSGNGLKTLSKNILVDWHTITETDLSNNPLSCDCHVVWMLEVYMRSEDRHTIRCESPSHLYGKLLKDVPRQDLACGILARFIPTRGRLGLGLLIFATLLFMTAALTFLFKCRHRIFPCHYGQPSKYRALYNQGAPEDEEIHISKTINVSETEKRILQAQAEAKLPAPVAL